MTATTTTRTEPAPPPTRTKWGLLATTLRAQRKNLIIGTLIGLVWMVGKISVPILVRFGIDRGIEQGDKLWFWASLVAVAGVLAGTFTALRRFYASVRPAGPRRACASACSATSCRSTSATTTDPRQGS